MENPKLINWINKLDAHYRLYLSFGIALIVFLTTINQYPIPICVTTTWLAFALSSLSLSWITILTSHPIEVRKTAKIQDSNRTLIFLIVLLASVISLLAVILLLKSTKESPFSEAAHHSLLPLSSVICA